MENGVHGRQVSLGGNAARGQIDIRPAREACAPRQRAEQNHFFCAEFAFEQFGGLPGKEGGAPTKAGNFRALFGPAPADGFQRAIFLQRFGGEIQGSERHEQIITFFLLSLPFRARISRDEFGIHIAQDSGNGGLFCNAEDRRRLDFTGRGFDDWNIFLIVSMINWFFVC